MIFLGDFGDKNTKKERFLQINIHEEILEPRSLSYLNFPVVDDFRLRIFFDERTANIKKGLAFASFRKN